jgi:hypothetical protein
MHKQNLACSPFEARNRIFRDPLKSRANQPAQPCAYILPWLYVLILTEVSWSVFYCDLININCKCRDNYTDLTHFHRIVFRDCDCAYRSVRPGSRVFRVYKSHFMLQRSTLLRSLQLQNSTGLPSTATFVLFCFVLFSYLITRYVPPSDNYAK